MLAEETYIGVAGRGDINEGASFEMFHGNDENGIYTHFISEDDECNIYVYCKHYSCMPFIKIAGNIIHTANKCVIKVEAETWEMLYIDNQGLLEVGDYDDYVGTCSLTTLNDNAEMQVFYGEDENGKFTRFMDVENTTTIILKGEHYRQFPDNFSSIATATNCHLIMVSTDGYWKIESAHNFGMLELR
ncbi:MAG: hypothetical protein FWG85_03415 [Bacteroidetes bacterium]|nr:hypothetical protein [Bacteroidota bacterium]